MNRSPLLAAVALAACSSQAPETATGNRVAAATASPATSITPQPPVAPEPGELKTFADWTVGCDNARACRAVALVPDDVDRDGYLLLVIDRAGDAAAPPWIRIPLDSVAPGARATLAVDGKPVAHGVAPRPAGDVTLPLDRALATALAGGHRATLAAAGAKPAASASLAGLAAALLYIDDQQGRVGTADALIRVGPKPSTSIPAPPPLPVIVEPPMTGAAAKTISPAAAARLIGPDNARCDNALGPVAPRAIRLDATHSLVLVDHPCGNGAYNLFTSAYIVDETGHAAPAAFDRNTGMGPDDTRLVNAGWDPEPRLLTSFAKGRGLGDCGVAQKFAWDGARFRLAEQTMMGECRGSIDYITTWRASVVRR